MRDYTTLINLLNQWGKYNRGIGLSSLRSLWPDKFYEGGPESGRVTARGKATRSTYHGDAHEWPNDVIEVQRAISALLNYHQDAAPSLMALIRVEYSREFEEALPVRARQIGLSKSSYINRRKLIWSWLDQYLFGER